jgi:hypothetical protein
MITVVARQRSPAQPKPEPIKASDSGNTRPAQEVQKAWGGDEPPSFLRVLSVPSTGA